MSAQTFAILWMIALAVFSAVCFRVATWHRHEAGFWREIELLDHFDMAPADAPVLLTWVQRNRPTFSEKLRGWRAPHVRRRVADDQADQR